ncbi:MAG TPA: SAM-dependent methyltransferase [Methylomirabilota bacterium]|nr:SAM-dependent methyltransferase [Methylomirabilota bacterium]
MNDHLRTGLRREPPTDLTDVGEDTGLLDRIRAEIRATGPMPFARFMELALYDPDGGYYRSPEARPGRGGDFVTAPELHPIFGATLAGAIEEIWRRLGEPSPFVVRELGAGTGALAVAILDGLRATGSPLLGSIVYEPVEVDPRRVEGFARRLAAAGHAARVRTRTDDEPIVGIVLGNEVLDALPVHRVRRRGGSLREIGVDVGPDGRLFEAEIEPPTPAVATYLERAGIQLVDGQTAEFALGLDSWVADAVDDLARGVLLLIDYGAPAAELYDPVRRRDGTLRAYVRHQVHDDPYRYVGRQDLTAHVDVTAVERAAHRAGLTTIGITTQAEALMGMGVEARLRAIQADPATTLEDYTLVRSALMRLLDPAAMGRFRVMAFGRDWPAPTHEGPRLGLFAFQMPASRRSTQDGSD